MLSPAKVVEMPVFLDLFIALNRDRSLMRCFWYESLTQGFKPVGVSNCKKASVKQHGSKNVLKIWLSENLILDSPEKPGVNMLEGLFKGFGSKFLKSSSKKSV